MQRPRTLDAAVVSVLLAMGFPASRAMAQTSTTLSGLPVQVQPYAPEPGVPLITVSPGTSNPFAGGIDPPGAGSAGAAADTTGDAGGGSVTASINSGSVGNGGAAGGGAATGSGSVVAVNYSQYLGQSVGSGQCAVLVEAADPSVGLTATWVQGASVQGNTSLAPGTIVATFGPNGTYTGLQDGSAHAAIYLGQNDQGIQVMDQWAGQAAGIRTIPWNSSSSLPISSGSNYYVVSHRSRNAWILGRDRRSRCMGRCRLSRSSGERTADRNVPLSGRPKRKHRVDTGRSTDLRRVYQRLAASLLDWA